MSKTNVFANGTPSIGRVFRGMVCTVTALFLTACTNSNPTDITGNQVNLSKNSAAVPDSILPNNQSISTRRDDAVTQALETVKWVGEGHKLGMDYVTAAFVTKRKTRKMLSKQDECEIIANSMVVAASVTPESARNLTLNRDGILRQKRPDCFANGLDFTAARFSVMMVEEDSIRPIVQDYIFEMQTAIELSDASVSSVTAIVTSVMENAVSTLNQVELEVLGSVGSLAISSAQTANSFDWSGGGTNCETYLILPDECHLEQISFRSDFRSSLRAGWWSKIRAAIVSDVSGCVGGLMGAWETAAGLAVIGLGATSSLVLEFACLDWGVLGSASAFLAS